MKISGKIYFSYKILEMLSHMSRFDLFKTHCGYPSSREGDLSGVAPHPGFGTAGAGGLMHARAHGA